MAVEIEKVEPLEAARREYLLWLNRVNLEETASEAHEEALFKTAQAGKAWLEEIQKHADNQK